MELGCCYWTQYLCLLKLFQNCTYVCSISCNRTLIFTWTSEKCEKSKKMPISTGAQYYTMTCWRINKNKVKDKNMTLPYLDSLKLQFRFSCLHDIVYQYEFYQWFSIVLEHHSWIFQIFFFRRDHTLKYWSGVVCSYFHRMKQFHPILHLSVILI